MADDWIKYRIGLPTNPKVVRIAGILRKPIAHVTGSLMAFWAVGDQHTTDGRLDGYTPEVVDDLVGVRGFSEALQSVGWLEVGEGYVAIPDFEEHNSQSAKRRAAKAKNMAASRGRSVVSDDHKMTTTRPQNDHALTTKCPPEKEKEKEKEKREEPKPKTGAAPPLFLPAVLDTPEFRAAWLDYEANRKEAGHAKLTTRGREAKFKDLADWGHDVAVQSIRESIANGWQGIFKPKGNANGNGSRNRPSAYSEAADRRAAKAAREFPEPDLELPVFVFGGDKRPDDPQRPSSPAPRSQVGGA